MDTAQILVTLFGLLLSATVIWYFFFSKKERHAIDAMESGLQQVAIKVKGGYDPDVIVVKAGKPVQFDFYREETADCSEQVLLPAFHKSAMLTPFETVSVNFTPDQPGEYDFSCGMGMLRGKIVVES